MEEVIPKGFSLEGRLDSERIHWIKIALKSSGGNKTHAAEKLGINRTCLIEMMKRLDLSLGLYVPAGGIK